MIPASDTVSSQPIPAPILADLARRQAAAEKALLEFQRDWYRAFATVGEIPENWTVTPDGLMVPKSKPTSAVKEFPKAAEAVAPIVGAAPKRKGGWPKGKPRKVKTAVAVPEGVTSPDGKTGAPNS